MAWLLFLVFCTVFSGLEGAPKRFSENHLPNSYPVPSSSSSAVKKPRVEAKNDEVDELSREALLSFFVYNADLVEKWKLAENIPQKITTPNPPPKASPRKQPVVIIDSDDEKENPPKLVNSVAEAATSSGKSSSSKHVISSSVPGRRDDILFYRFSIPVTVDLLGCLQPGIWLNDEIINIIMEMIKRRNNLENTASVLPRIFTHNSFFFSSFDDEKRALIPRDKTNSLNPMLASQMIFFPLHVKDRHHWALAVMDMRKKTFLVYDSIAVGPALAKTYLGPLRRWVERIYRDRSKSNFSWSGWVIGEAVNVPQQSNYVDCGVFMLVTADRLARGLPLIHSQKEINRFRSLIHQSIIEDKLLLETPSVPSQLILD